MNKPVFLWWAHKMMWGLIADNPGMGKETAFRTMRKKCGNKNLMEMPLMACYACHSAFGRRNHVWDYRCNYCPLDWGEYKGCNKDSSLYDKWLSAMSNIDYPSAAKYARIIANLPLKENAHEMYDIKESPDE